MIEEFLASGTLNIVYAAILLVSFVFALLSLIGSEIGDAFDFDIDAEGFDFISISPFTLAMFGAFFSLAGLITRIWLEMEQIPSILWSFVIGLVVGIAFQALFVYVISPTSTSHFNLAEDAIGREAEVIITIPADGMGQIAFDNMGGRQTLGARSLADVEIKRGVFVEIERITGRVAFVKPIEN